MKVHLLSKGSMAPSARSKTTTGEVKTFENERWGWLVLGKWRFQYRPHVLAKSKSTAECFSFKSTVANMHLHVWNLLTDLPLLGPNRHLLPKCPSPCALQAARERPGLQVWLITAPTWNKPVVCPQCPQDRGGLFTSLFPPTSPGSSSLITLRPTQSSEVPSGPSPPGPAWASSSPLLLFHPSHLSSL